MQIISTVYQPISLSAKPLLRSHLIMFWKPALVATKILLQVSLVKQTAREGLSPTLLIVDNAYKHTLAEWFGMMRRLIR